MTTHEHVYRAVAEAQVVRWGYNETLEAGQYERWLQAQATDTNLRADADAAILAWSKEEGR